MDDFRTASTIEARGDGRFAWEVPDGWQQGKGAFGGLVIGTLARAMEAVEPEATTTRRLRSISADLCAAMMAGPTEIAVEVLRRGRGTTYVAALARQGGEVIARANALFGASRPPSVARVAVPPPALPDFVSVPAPPMGMAPTPRFTSRFEFRPVGPWPFAGAPAPSASGWLRERGAIAQPTAPLDAPAVIGLLDAWWPCALVMETKPRAMATVAFTAELIADPATLDGALPFAYRGELAGEADGYSVELRQLWQGDRLVGLNQQTFAAL